jgi:hypothetical protein
MSLKTSRMQFVLFGMQNRTFGPYLLTMNKMPQALRYLDPDSFVDSKAEAQEGLDGLADAAVTCLLNRAGESDTRCADRLTDGHMQP